MLKTEFEELIQGTIPDQDYKVIEKVYQFHPAVSEVCGKEEVAELYKSFGMTVFFDMLPRAEMICRAEMKRPKEQVEVDNTIKKICQWIDRELEKEETSIGNVTDVVSALAVLIAARHG